MALRRVGETTVPIISLRKQSDKETGEVNYQLCVDMEFWDCLLETLSNQPDMLDELDTTLDNMKGAIQKVRDGENIKTG